MAEWHIAQMNVGTALFPLDDPRLADFMNQLDEVNALAEASPGFVWRLKADDGNATSIKASDDPKFIVNMSVWQSVESLFDYVYKTAHRLVMARRREWFDRPVEAYQVLWWVEPGTAPSVADGLARLRHLETHGPTPYAFTFKQKFPHPETGEAPQDMRPEPYCVGWE